MYPHEAEPMNLPLKRAGETGAQDIKISLSGCPSYAAVLDFCC